jgi:hypothetical protein
MKNQRYLQSLIRFFKSIGVELLILFAVLFTINNYIGNVDRRISADGIGYYEYLPSIFIHHDLNRKDIPVDVNHSKYKRVNDLDMYVDFKERWVNKYPSGTALLQSPFFLTTLVLTERTSAADDGYQQAFQKSVFYAALFYLFLSLVFLKRLLLSYSISTPIIILSQVLLVFATSVLNYVNFESAFSHIYSLFAISAFLYVARIYFTQKKLSYFLWACLLLGLIFILRQVNVLIFFFLPFVAGNWSTFREGVVLIFKEKKHLIAGIVLFFSVALIQFYLWYLQTGHFWVYSYQGESFDFSNPELFNILFSYKKGLFVYTPILLFGILGVFYFLFKKEYFLFSTWIIFFGLLTYILSSWWSWYYGCSYGLRAYIDYYPIFFLPFALFLNQINRKSAIALGLISFSTIPISVIQTYQYKEYILHWIDMDKEKFWKVFLETEDQFKGLVWKDVYQTEDYTILDRKSIGNIKRAAHTYDVIATIPFNEIKNSEEINLLLIRLTSDFNSTDNSKIVISLDSKSTDENYYWNNRSILHFHKDALNKKHQGYYFFKIEPIPDMQNAELNLLLETLSADRTLENIEVLFCKLN